MASLEFTSETWNIAKVEFTPLQRDLQEISDLSLAQTKLTIRERDVEAQIPLLKALDFYKNDDKDPLRQKSDQKEKFKELFPDIVLHSRLSNDRGGYYSSPDLKWKVLCLKKCYENDNIYFFISDSWYYFSVQKQDFDKNWFMAQTLTLLSEFKETEQWPLFLEEHDWKSTYIYQWFPSKTFNTPYCIYSSTPNDHTHTTDIIYQWHGSMVYKSRVALEKDWTANNEEKLFFHSSDQVLNLGLWEIKKLALDSHQNVLFVISESEEWKSNLHVLEHKLLFDTPTPIQNKLKTIEWISDIILLPHDNIILSKLDWTIDLVWTNLSLLDPNSSLVMKDQTVQLVKDAAKEKLLNDLQWFPLSGNSANLDISCEEDKEIITTIRKKTIESTWKTFKALFEEAKSEEEIQFVDQLWNQINQKFPEIRDLLRKNIGSKIITKKNQIILSKIESDILKIQNRLNANSIKFTSDAKEKKVYKKLR